MFGVFTRLNVIGTGTAKTQSDKLILANTVELELDLRSKNLKPVVEPSIASDSDR